MELKYFYFIFYYIYNFSSLLTDMETNEREEFDTVELGLTSLLTNMETNEREEFDTEEEKLTDGEEQSDVELMGLDSDGEYHMGYASELKFNQLSYSRRRELILSRPYITSLLIKCIFCGICKECHKEDEEESLFKCLGNYFNNSRYWTKNMFSLSLAGCGRIHEKVFLILCKKKINNMFQKCAVCIFCGDCRICGEDVAEAKRSWWQILGLFFNYSHYILTEKIYNTLYINNLI